MGEESAATLQSLLAVRLAAYQILWRDEGTGFSKVIITTPGLMHELKEELEREIPGCYTQHLVTKELGQ